MLTRSYDTPGAKEKRKGPLWDLWRNTVTDAREIGPGMIMGPIMLGRDLVSDAAHLDLSMPRTSKTLGGVVQGFNQNSWIPSVAKGDFDEAAGRFHARPISGILDLTGVAGMGASGVAKLSRVAAAGAPTRASRINLMKGAGFEHIGDVKKVPNVNAIPDTLRYRFRTGEIVGDDVFAKPTHRRILPSQDDPLLLKDPISPQGFHDIRRSADIDPDIADRLGNLNAWKRVSRNPLWRGVGEAQAELRRTTIPHDRPFSSSKQGMRRMRRGVEGSLAISYATARDLHEPANRQFMDEVANSLREKNLRDVDIKELADYTTYLSANGYSNLGHRVADLEGTHKGHNQAARATRKLPEMEVAGAQADAIRTTIDDMKARGISMQDPRVEQLRRDLAAKERTRQSARAANAASARYEELRAKPGPHGASDPLSGYRGHEEKMIQKFNERHPGLIDEVMQSGAMERWLDNVELASIQMEELAIKNYGRGLSANEAINNRYRMADLYQPQGITDETKRLYSRQRKDGKGVRAPLFVPMRDKATDALPQKATSGKNPFMEKPEDVMGDPMDLELWNQNSRNPITGGLFLKKHAKELTDYHMNRHIDMARKLAVPMPRKTAEQWRTMQKHEAQQSLTIALPSGKPHNTAAPFIDIGEFAETMDVYRSGLNEIADGMRREGNIVGANAVAAASKTAAVAASTNSPKLRTGGGLSTRQMERTEGMQGGMTTILPTPVYASLVNDMLHSAQVIMEVAGAPSARKSFESGLGTTMKYWRYSVLHTRPKWMFNNAIGSIYMLAMQEGWGPAFTNILRSSTLFNWARNFLGIKKKDYDRGGSRYINEIVANRMSDVLYSSGSSSMFGFSDKDLGSVGRIDKAFDKVASFNSQVADNPPRIARIMTLLDEMVDNHVAHQSALGKKITKSRDELRIEVLDNVESRERLAQTALEDMIDFQDLSKAERQLVAYAMPFYSWIKGSSKATMRHIADQPGRFTFQKELGLEAGRQVEEQFPQGVPAYMLSSLPGGWTGNNKNKIVNFAGASPAATFFDVAAMAPSFIGGVPTQFGTESPLGMMNPFITAGVAGETMRHPFYGTPFARTMTKPEVWLETGMPPFMRSLYKSGFDMPGPIGPMRKNVIYGDPYAPSGNEVSRHNPASYWWRLMAPIQQEVIPGNAASRYREEREDLGF